MYENNLQFSVTRGLMVFYPVILNNGFENFSTNFEVALNPADIYLLKVNYRNTRIRCERCSKLTIRTPEGQ